MPMKIFINVEEAAQRLEELIDLARQDEVYVCRCGWPIAQLTSCSESKEAPRSGEIAAVLPEKEPTVPESKLVEGGNISSVDEAWMVAAKSKPRRKHDMTSAHDDLYDENGLPR